ncbi:spore germination protein GerPC [Paenibacillus sp. CC-CFT747]|nr:spore germination protein GerPC [Paenibacillus sp. CC-CFT747]
MDWYGLLCQIKGHLEWQSRKLLEVEARLAKLESSVASLQDKPQTRIDKIDYHFDQLKVERLDGTLNIGITPGKDGADSIEEFAVNQRKPVQAEGQPAEAGVPRRSSSGRLEKRWRAICGRSFRELSALWRNATGFRLARGTGNGWWRTCASSLSPGWSITPAESGKRKTEKELLLPNG